eukprot:SAG31_NODE_19447_length_601_cov_4.589641_1_plen_28_part_01
MLNRANAKASKPTIAKSEHQYIAKPRLT